MIVYFVTYLFLIINSFFTWLPRKNGIIILVFILLYLTVLVGFRENAGPDSLRYVDFFYNNTSTIPTLDFNIRQYSEKGFYLLSVFIKTIYPHHLLYFCIIAFITFWFYYKSIKKISIYPLITICIYYVRFLPFREMNQIRGGLAISIIIYALVYLIDGNKRRYIYAVLIASLIHISSIIALPYVLLCNTRINTKKIIYLISLAFIFGFGLSTFLQNILLNTGNIIFQTYIGETGSGFTNPILYFQIGICILYSHYEKRLKPVQKGYNIIKNAYLYSVLILCLTAGLGSIGGRLSTIFATCEIFIIPSFILVFKQKYIGYACIMCLTTLVFLLNYNRMLAEAAKWSYKLSFA